MIFLDSKVRMPLMSLPVRTCVIPVNGGRVLFSPGSKLSPEDLRSAGDVTDIVAPSLFHGGGMKQASEVFPHARVWGVPGLKEQKPEVPWTHLLTEESWAYPKELPMVMLRGAPKTNEAEFYHIGSKTLIITDLCFNLRNARGFGSWMILSLFGTYRKFGVSKLFLKYVADRDAFSDSLKRILQWPFEKIVMAHGETVEHGAQEIFRKALRERGLPDRP